MGGSFRDLFAWQRAIQLCVAVYGMTSSFPQKEEFGLSSQLRRAVVSTASNIAEGSARSRKEYCRFLSIAIGSNFEVETQLVIVREVGMCTGPELNHVEALCNETGRLLNGLKKKLQSSPSPAT